MMGAMTRPIFKFRPTSPSEHINHPKGFAIAKTKIVGASKRKIGAATIHFGPRSTKIISSAKRAEAIVIGKVIARTREYPFKK